MEEKQKENSVEHNENQKKNETISNSKGALYYERYFSRNQIQTFHPFLPAGSDQTGRTGRNSRSRPLGAECRQPSGSKICCGAGCEDECGTRQNQPPDLRTGEKTFEMPEGQALMKKWGLGEEYQCHSIVPLGYIAKETPTHARKENRIIYDQPE